MIGIIFKSGDNIFIKYGVERQLEIPVLEQKKEYEIGSEVEFEIVDEFTHPEKYIGIPLFEGIKYAKIL